MTSPHTTLARPGDIVRIDGPDYLHGTTTVTVRITGIDTNLDQIPGLEWIHILTVDPNQPNAEPRALIVRATALRRSRNPPRMPALRTPGAPGELASGTALYGRLPPSGQPTQRQPLSPTTRLGTETTLGQG